MSQPITEVVTSYSYVVPTKKLSVSYNCFYKTNYEFNTDPKIRLDLGESNVYLTLDEAEQLVQSINRMLEVNDRLPSELNERQSFLR
jgi:hypothetical protein